MPSEIHTSSITSEYVADINGIAIIDMWQANKNNMISEMRERVLELVKIEPIKYKFIIDSLSLLPTILTEPAQYLHFATIYMAEISEYIHRIAQISDYNWLDINSITQCYTVLNKYMQSEYYTCEQVYIIVVSQNRKVLYIQ